jgi:hypothetical protein
VLAPRAGSAVSGLFLSCEARGAPACYASIVMMRSIATVGLLGAAGLLIDAQPLRACDPAILSVPALMGNYPPLVITTARPGAWWWVVSGTSLDRLQLRDSNDVAVEATFLRAGPEWLGVQVPDNSESGTRFTFDDPAASPLELEVNGEVERSASPTLGEPELVHAPFVHAPGCGGFQELVERDRWVLWFDVDVAGDDSSDLAIDAWAIPEDLSFPPDDAPRRIEGLPFSGADESDGLRFALFAEEEGRYEVFARVRDLRNASTSEIQGAVVDVEPPHSAGCTWHGFGCSGGGVPWPLVLLVLIRSQRCARKTGNSRFEPSPP